MGSAQPFKLLILQNPQQLRLQLQRELSDLVQKQRALVGEFNSSDLLGHRSGESSLLITEQLAFHQARRNRRAIQFDETVVGALTQAMDGACHQFLTGSGFA